LPSLSAFAHLCAARQLSFAARAQPLRGDMRSAPTAAGAPCHDVDADSLSFIDRRHYAIITPTLFFAAIFAIVSIFASSLSLLPASCYCFRYTLFAIPLFSYATIISSPSRLFHFHY
jgi:hypothetical protein